MLDDDQRKAVMEAGDFSHPAASPQAITLSDNTAGAGDKRFICLMKQIFA